jgi:ubiquinone/menaquinone biosynthesis C-methylase UbiE
MSENVEMRPFYAHQDFARHYDRIIRRPNAARIAFIGTAFASHGIVPPARILDAGCGTGAFSIGLARRGYSVTGIDISRELVKVAQKKLEDIAPPIHVDLQIANILAIPQDGFDGMLCRGVLNDLIGEQDRKSAMRSFSTALRPEGILILDVRDWDHSVVRKKHDPVYNKVVRVDQGELTFTGITDLDEDNRRLISHETHTLMRDGELVAQARYDFVMQCWTREELHQYMSDVGFEEVALYGDFDKNKPVGTTDRIILVAKKLDTRS